MKILKTIPETTEEHELNRIVIDLKNDNIRLYYSCLRKPDPETIIGINEYLNSITTAQSTKLDSVLKSIIAYSNNDVVDSLPKEPLFIKK
jgi:hypothetical protein